MATTPAAPHASSPRAAPSRSPSPVSRARSAVSPAPVSVVGRSASSESARQRARKTTRFLDPALLRGSFSADALRHWGAVLDQGRRTDDWYVLSERCDHLDVFVSHNWSMSRLDKFLILALHLNLRAAVFCTALAVVPIAFLTMFGHMPAMRVVVSRADEQRIFPWCQVFGVPVFMLVLLCWQEFCRLSCFRGKLLFLDKACIHQSDAVLKQRGIEHLAAFLHYSWDLLVCYSDEYLQKLWTVYEVSSFMLLHPGCAIHVRHPWHAKFLIGGVVVVCMEDAIWHVEKALPLAFLDWDLEVLVMAIFMMPFQLAISVMVLKMAEQRMNMSERIEHFCFNKAKCHSEADRDSVRRNIIAFMKHHGHIAKGASDTDIVNNFESMIHCKLPKLFDASLGSAGFPYAVAACVSLPYILKNLDFVCAAFYDSMPLKHTCFTVVYRTTVYFATNPLSLAIQFSAARWMIRRCHFGRRTRVPVLGVTGMICTGGFFEVLNLTADMAWQGGPAEVVLFVMVVVFFCLVALYYYRPTWYQKHRRRLNAAHSI